MKAVYRIVNALLGIAVFPMMFFMDFFILRIGTTDKLSGIIESISQNGTQGIAIEEYFSIKRLFDIFNGKDELSTLLQFKHDGPFLWPKEFAPLNVRIVVFLVSFALILITALFIVIWSCCSNKHLPMFIAGIVGIAAVVAMIVSFNSMSMSVYHNQVNIIDYIVDQIIDSGVFAQLLGFAASAAVSVLVTFAGAQNAVLFVFIAVVCWTVIFFLADLGDPKAKEEKEKEKAKALAKKEARKKKKAAKKEAKASA